MLLGVANTSPSAIAALFILSNLTRHHLRFACGKKIAAAISPKNARLFIFCLLSTKASQNTSLPSGA
jgi:hypothetical protein